MGNKHEYENSYFVRTHLRVYGDGTHDIGDWSMAKGEDEERAFWVQRDLIDVWRYIWYATGGSQSPQETAGPATVEWNINSTGKAIYDPGGNIHLNGEHPLSNTVVGHEYGHNIMYTIYGYWPTSYCPSPHEIKESSHVNCAWVEGWAMFISLAVNNDPVYRWADLVSILNFEDPTWGSSGWDDGDDVEGRVTGALWDILDYNSTNFTNEGYDQYSGDFADIWDTIYHQNDDNFQEYWEAWKSRGHNELDAVMSIYQNTIDYRPQHTLNVNLNGTGLGRITGYGINCGDGNYDCSENYPHAELVTLYVTPEELDSYFVGWSGACSGTSPCVVSMTSDKSLTATFNKIKLTVNKSGTGSGIVTSSPSGISCGSDCTEDYTSGTSVTLTASADTGSVFAGWSGACSGTSTTCTVTMTEAKSVTATFNITTRRLDVIRSGTGSGTVSSSPSGISCGSDCSQYYNYGTPVTLTATPATGSVFTGWSGACAGTGACVVSMTSNKSVTATFISYPYVINITRADLNPTNASSVDFTVTFSESVTGVDTGDFQLTTSGLSGAWITSRSGSGSVYNITVNTGSGEGTLRLDLIDNDTIINAYTIPLGGVGAGNGNYTAGEEYAIGPPPDNDDFNAAEDISMLAYTHQVRTIYATVASDDPLVTTCGIGQGQATVWYTHTPGADSAIAIDTKSADYDTFIAVWTGSRGNLTLVACNDDVDGTTQSAIAFRVQGGVTYYIEIGQP